MTQDEIYDYVDNLSEEEFRACVMGALRRLDGGGLRLITSFLPLVIDDPSDNLRIKQLSH
jgi:hypothetical protein